MGRYRESYQARPVRRYRERRIPEVDDVRAGHARGRRGKHCYNPFDLTKVWPHADYPLIEVGVLELNRNPENYFAEVEQAAFSPSNIVPGIRFSPDKMLQARSSPTRMRTATGWASLRGCR